MADTITIGQAYELIHGKNDSLANTFKQITENVKLPEDKPLEEYVTFIADSPLAWINSLPEEWTTRNTLVKAKDCMYLLHKIKPIADKMDAKLKDMRERIKEAFGDEALGRVIEDRKARKEEKTAEALRASSLADGEIDADETSDTPPVADEQSDDDETDAGDTCSERKRARFSVHRIRAACIAFCEASGRDGLAAFMRAMWVNNATILPAEGDMLEEIVPRLLDGELEREVCKAIVKGSF